MTLSAADWPRLKQVFADTRALPAELRAAYLTEACGTNTALRHEVESLLASEADATSFLETPAVLLADPAPKLLDGQRIGPYEVASRIGAGGMGEVYRARDARLGRDVAIKMLPPTFASDPDRLARFDREARMLASLNHPHIGAIYGVEQSAGTPALILELVEGPTLADRRARPGLGRTAGGHAAGHPSSAPSLSRKGTGASTAGHRRRASGDRRCGR